MGMKKNSYEQKLIDRWMHHVSKREAESYLTQLRVELYGNPYCQVSPVVYGDGSSHMPRLPIWAKDAFDGKLPRNN